MRSPPLRHGGWWETSQSQTLLCVLPILRWEDLGTDGASCDASGSNYYAGSKHQINVNLASLSRHGVGVRDGQGLFMRGGCAVGRHGKLLPPPTMPTATPVDRATADCTWCFPCLCEPE